MPLNEDKCLTETVASMGNAMHCIAVLIGFSFMFFQMIKLMFIYSCKNYFMMKATKHGLTIGYIGCIRIKRLLCLLKMTLFFLFCFQLFAIFHVLCIIKWRWIRFRIKYFVDLFIYTLDGIPYNETTVERKLCISSELYVSHDLSQNFL